MEDSLDKWLFVKWRCEIDVLTSWILMGPAVAPTAPCRPSFALWNLWNLWNLWGTSALVSGVRHLFCIATLQQGSAAAHKVCFKKTGECSTLWVGPRSSCEKAKCLRLMGSPFEGSPKHCRFLFFLSYLLKMCVCVCVLVFMTNKDNFMITHLHYKDTWKN